MILFCIDPGENKSGIVLFDGKKVLLSQADMPNDSVLFFLLKNYDDIDQVIIEMIEAQGMPVGKTVFNTCIWIGRFIQQSEFCKINHSLIYRKKVKLFLCGASNAKDKNIRQAIIDRFEPTGGGKTPQIGTKKNPGALYGVSSHAWPALAVGLAWLEQHEETKRKLQNVACITQMIDS